MYLTFPQLQAYSGLVSGAAVMISIHNMFYAIFLYKTRQTNVSNLIKIILNFSNIFRFGGMWSFYMTPELPTLSLCVALQCMNTVGSEVARISVTAFLLWRLKQVADSKLDSWFGIIALTIRLCLAASLFFFQKPTLLYTSDRNFITCDTNGEVARDIILSMTLFEIVVDSYVTFRLVQILREGNKNSALISSITKREKKRTTSFTAVMYWNFFRLFIALISHVMPLLNMFMNFDEPLFLTLFPLVSIILSYVITSDAEIVRVIEGNDAEKGRTLHDNHKLSFFEWVMKKCLHRDDEEQYDEDMED